MVELMIASDTFNKVFSRLLLFGLRPLLLYYSSMNLYYCFMLFNKLAKMLKLQAKLTSKANESYVLLYICY